MGKIKLIKKQIDVLGNMNLFDFAAQKISVVPEDYVLIVEQGLEEEEVTTLENLKILYNIGKIDFRAFRFGLVRLDELKGGAVGMSSEEKAIAAVHFAFDSGADLIAEVPEIRDRIKNGFHSFHVPAIESRKARFRYSCSIIYNTVNPVNVANLITIFTTPVTPGEISLWISYIEFGIEGTEYGDSEGLLDYIHSVVGTTWEANGLREEITGNLQAAPNNLTVDEILVAIENVLINGILEIP